MTITPGEQIDYFLIASALGVLFALFFDILSAVIVFTGIRKAWRNVLECLLGVLCAMVSYFYFLTFLNGELRVYSFFAMALGVLLWYGSVGRFRRKLLEKLIKKAISTSKRLQGKRKKIFFGKKAENSTKKV